jgi:tetratricopeptide (TPR) repeat protein/tRNA A-37 threonylcarbamoyl transferase component Bud32
MTRTAAEIFHSALALPIEQRESYLLGACGQDEPLRTRVRALLAADAAAGGFMASPTRVPVDPSTLAGEAAGAEIGRYKLLEQIGEGGMGTIWMAEQREPVKRRVALKIIKLGMDTRQVIARFEAERQALALMDHPNIAKVLDAGATETGRPYFVMEYIRGVPILEYCDQTRLDTRARLELFASVCHAIQHAHQKGIIHRDIKPSNVLVTLHDGVPVPKVIDFGIAKATNSELTTKTLFTEHRQMIGTPAYMSPEQAELSGLDIDTRSDLYSLGVLLYELLTGTTPFDTKALLESGFAEMLRAIREDEPHKPSTRISSLGDTGTRTAQQRRVELKKLSTLLRGDLDWIVMKCLEKDRSRRYDTANGLAADIRRHLAGDAVLAAPPSAGYRARKFVRRHRAQVIAASVVLTALLVAIVGTAWGMVETSRARSATLQRSMEDEQRAAAESARRVRNAEAVGAHLGACEDALRAGDVAKAGIALDAARKRSAEGGAEKDAGRLARLGADLELVVALDAVDQFRWTWTDNKFATTQDVAARMRAALEKFGANPEQVSVESAAAAVNASAVRERIVATLDRQLNSRHSKEVRALLRLLDADPYRNEVRDSNLAQDTPKLLELVQRPAALEQPAEFAAFLGEVNQVAPDRRLELLQAAVLRRPRDMSVLMALQRTCLKDLPQRLRWGQAAVAAAPTNVAAYGNLGVALKESGRLEDAIACYHRSIELEPNSAAAYTNLANALDMTGHFEESLANHRKATELDPAGFENYCCLGSTLGRHGRAEEALVALRTAVEHEPKHAEAHYTMGVTLGKLGRWPQALDAFKKAIECNPELSVAYADAGVALRNVGRLDEAVGYFQKSIELDPQSALVRTNLAGVLYQLGRRDEAFACCKKAIEVDPKSAVAFYNMGTFYADQGPLEDAVANYRRAIELDPNYAEPHCNLAQVLKSQGLYEESLAEFKRGHELGSARPDWNYPSADWIRDAEAQIAKTDQLQLKLPGLLSGGYQPSDNAERLKFAYLCQDKKLNCAAAGLLAAALAADPKIGDSLEGCVRYNAACVAALGAAGQGEDSANLDEAERARLRKQALAWLRADLDLAASKLESGNPADRAIVPLALNNFLHQADLVSIREPAALARLPADELQAFAQLWADMAALLKKALPPPVQKDEQKLAAFNTRGLALISQGKLAEGEQALADGVAACRRAFAEPHPLTAVLLHHHADALRALGRQEDALREAQAAVDLYRDHSDWHADEATHASSILASILRAMGRTDEAIAAGRESLAILRRALPAGSAEFAGKLASISLDLVKDGKLVEAREAEPLLRECLEIRVKAIPGDWRVGNTRSLLGGAILLIAELDPALTPEARALRMREAEPLLLEGQQWMKEREAAIPPEGKVRLTEALERVAQLYEAWNKAEPGQGYDTKAAEWKAKR